MLIMSGLFSAFLRDRLAPLKQLPRRFWLILMLAFGLLLGWRWHQCQVSAAFTAGGVQQQAADRVRFEAAAAAAVRAQSALRRQLSQRQSIISKGSDDALVAQNAGLAQRYADLRLRWVAARTHQGSTAHDGAIAVSNTAGTIADAACAATGWVDFNTAAAAAEAADRALAKDDAWIGWARAQAATWPRSAALVPATDEIP